MKELLCEVVAKEIANTSAQDVSALLEVPPEKEMVDLALPCFGFQVGISAVIFHDLFNQRIKNIDFVWTDVLNFEGSKG